MKPVRRPCLFVLPVQARSLHHGLVFRKTKLWYLLPALCALGIYLNGLRGSEFVWDDTALVLRDPFIRTPLMIPEGFRHFLFTDATPSSFYRPIQRLTFTFDYLVFGLKPWGFKLMSALWHAAAATALALFLSRLLAGWSGRSGDAGRPNVPFACVIAAIWAIHPLHTSAVAYISGRADSLSACFGFLALARLLAARSGERRSWLPTALLLLLAALSKESGLMFLPIALALSLMPLTGRVPGRIAGEASPVLPALRIMGPALCIALVLGAYVLLRMTAQQEPPPPTTPDPFAERVRIAARGVAGYAKLGFWPSNLHMEHDLRTVEEGGRASARPPSAMLGALLAIGYIALTVFLAARKPGPPAFLAVAGLLAFLPVSGLLPLNANFAEHWLYAPSAFLLALAVIGFHALLERIPLLFTRRALYIVAGVWVALLGAQTWNQTRYWATQSGFLRTTIARGGDSDRMYIGLAGLTSVSAPAESFRILVDVALRNPKLGIAHLNMANALERLDRPVDALNALAVPLVDPAPRMRAQALLLTSKIAAESGTGDPLALLEQAVATSPHDEELVVRYATLLGEVGREADAQQLLQDHLEFFPWHRYAWKRLGRIQIKSGNPADGLASYKHAAKLDIRDAEARDEVHRLSNPKKSVPAK